MQNSVTSPASSPSAFALPAPVLAALGAIALLVLIVPALIVSTMPRTSGIAKLKRAHPAKVISRRELPPVEPVRLVAVAPRDAREFNATIPFSTAPNPPARPFRFAGSDADRTRAIDCLAAAQFYEAGDDPVGQRAVAQVVLNRARHPAYPGTVCGVVFQGHERRTGCQFTFTCDGAMRRTPSPAAWNRARAIAASMLNGEVYAAVGHATHYHTDWVVPYWSASLDKIVEVNTHLFFRWTGWWGTPPAFRRRHAGSEPVFAKLGQLSNAHFVAESAAGPADTLAEGSVAAIPESAIPQPSAAGEDTFLVVLDRRMAPDAFAALAIRTCGERPYCKFMGWTNAARRPTALPASQAQLDAMSFSYLRNRDSGFGKALWNCTEFSRPSPVQCMRTRVVTPVLTPTRAVSPVTGERVELPGGLSGVRRRAEPAPAAPAPPATTPIGNAN